MTPSSTESSSRTTDGTESVGLSLLPQEEAFDLDKFRESEDGKKLVSWVLNEFEKAASARTQFEESWRTNLQYLLKLGISAPGSSVSNKIAAAKSPDQAKRRKSQRINRIRSFARTEHSKFISQEPTIVAVPASSEDSDFRAAGAAEQAYRSISEASHLDQHVSDAMWWKVITGNAYLKTYWDGTARDSFGEPGMVRYGAVTPFHLYVPDLREPSLEDQPFVINGYSKTLAWAKQRFPGKLDDCAPGMLSLDRKIDNPATSNVSEPPHSVVVLEVWVKPGVHKLLPQGGMLHLVGSYLVGITFDFPYHHGAFPYAHFGHLYTGGFYRESSVDDLISLQEEYNDIRADIRRAARLAGRPQFTAQKGSFAVAKWTNEAGLVIEYNPGFAAPQPLALPELPAYVQAQQDRILADFEDISGQHEVSRGQAPGRGVTAGTAIAYLQESDDQYLTPQYRADEYAYEKIAKQTLELFVQFVDHPRKLRSLGADRAFDTLLLSGADIKNGTDVRVEKGSTISTSQVARRAEIKEMVGMGMLSPEQGLELLEMGGTERLRETLDVARAKAQRENIKLQNLDVLEIIQAEDQAVLEGTQGASPEGLIEQLGGMEIVAQSGISPEDVLPAVQQQIREQMPPIIPADDFDIHALHIDVHNQYRMSQGYEQLDDRVKEQIEKHIAMHEQFIVAEQQRQLESQGGLPPQAPSEADVADAMRAGQSQVPAGPLPEVPEEGIGEAGEEPTRAEQFKAGVPPQTPGV